MRTWYRSTIGGLPKMYWFLWTGMLINRVGGFVALVLSLYLTSDRGLKPSAAGLVVGLYGIGGIAGVLLGGVLADRWGRRPTLLLAHFGAVVFLAGLAMTTHIPTIAALAALLGLMHAMPGPAFVAAIVDVVPDRDRSRAFNLQFWAFNLGMAAASLIAGLLAEVSFALLFAVDAAGTLVTAVLLLWKVRETKPVAQREAEEPRGGLHTALTDRAFLSFVGLSLLLAVVTLQSSTILPLAITADGLRPTVYGSVVAYAGLLIVAGQLFVPKLIDRWRKGTTLAVANVFLGLGVACVALAADVPGYLLAATVWTVGSMLAAPPNAAVIAELSPEALRGRYQSVFYLIFPAASFIAPAAGGASLEFLGDWHWVICGGLGAVAAVGHLLIQPARERRVHAAAAARRERLEVPVAG
ncbi:MDR family MFS transporter [Dactylosporangium siamense]|uniref:MFS transporter n=1 Tax=Dactylosporangium siamense TaxID=685454 RepID=A0A919PXI4_9ACTN|nr:MFS transporter [Dactylosporangium siamense]